MKKRAKYCNRTLYNASFDRDAMRCSPSWSQDGNSQFYPQSRDTNQASRFGRGPGEDSLYGEQRRDR